MDVIADVHVAREVEDGPRRGILFYSALKDLRPQTGSL
jgi:hypothetical protein